MFPCDAASECDAQLDERADSLHESLEGLLRDLVEMRNHHHLSQAEVAARMGVTQPTVSSFERYDCNPTLSTVRRYALSVGARLRIVVEDDLERAAVNRQFETIVMRDRWTTGSSERGHSVSWGAASVVPVSHG